MAFASSDAGQGSIPLRVKFGSPGAQLDSPLYRQEQTSSAGPVRSEKCHMQTFEDRVSSSNTAPVSLRFVAQEFCAPAQVTSKMWVT